MQVWKPCIQEGKKCPCFGFKITSERWKRRRRELWHRGSRNKMKKKERRSDYKTISTVLEKEKQFHIIRRFGRVHFESCHPASVLVSLSSISQEQIPRYWARHCFFSPACLPPLPCFSPRNAGEQPSPLALLPPSLLSLVPPASHPYTESCLAFLPWPNLNLTSFQFPAIPLVSFSSFSISKLTYFLSLPSSFFVFFSLSSSFYFQILFPASHLPYTAMPTFPFLLFNSLLNPVSSFSRPILPYLPPLTRSHNPVPHPSPPVSPPLPSGPLVA